MSESWDTVTAYGNVDMTLHPVLRRAYRVACLIERCGASPELTAASSAAFDLCGEIASAIEALQERLDAAYAAMRTDWRDLVHENDALRAKLAESTVALHLAYDAMRAPIDDWKGVLERKAMDAYHAAIAAGGDDAKD